MAIGDGLLFAEVDGRATILTSWLERDRIAAVLPDAEILDFVDLGMRALVEDGMTRLGAEREVCSARSAQLGIGDAVVPGDFPVAIADRLRADGITLTIDDGVVAARRRVKEGAELAGIRAAQTSRPRRHGAGGGATGARPDRARRQPAPRGRRSAAGRDGARGAAPARAPSTARRARPT